MRTRGKQRCVPAPDGGLPDLILSRGGVLSGRVADASGEPLAGILVRASQGYYSGYGTWYDPNIGYTYYDPNLVAQYEGVYDINNGTVYGSGSGYYDPNVSSGTEWEYDPNSYGPGNIDYTYTYPGYYPSEDFSATTKEDGTYRITGLPGRDYWLSAVDPAGIYLDAQYSGGDCRENRN